MSISQSVNTGLRRVPVWLVYLLGALPPLWYFYQGFAGYLGPEPIKEVEHLVGELALQMFVAILAVTPLRVWSGISLLKFRRAMGVLCFYYVAFHLAVWLVLDVQDPAAIWADIVKRPYITIGMIAFVLMIPLAATSNNLSLRKMGPVAWRRLHKLTFAAAVLGAVHFIMLRKGFQIEPLVYLALILGLLATRLIPARRPVRARAA